ncbi:MAG TPA: sensor histidine kinase [Steroidobacteraceae bacterium]|nr:sensor histidine kinase [Steroidobacteraceae bacterium]
MPNDERASTQAFFLPDFCAGRMVLALVLITELVAFVFSLARQAVHDNFWVDLAAASMFMLWLGLGCAAVLCRARPWLMRMTTAAASTLALFLVAVVVALVSEVTFQLGQYLSGGQPSALVMFPEQHAAFLMTNLGIGFIVSALTFRYFYVNAEWKRTIELETQARIRALQARIRPHFLFNSMNTIASLTRSNPEQAEQAVEDLADLFRANLSDARERIALSEELEVAKVYQRIEQLRMGDRLKVEWQVGTLPGDALVPSLLLQPLLENAVYHGIERLSNGGVITVAGNLENNVIKLVVVNPLADNASASERDGNKLALDNIKQRMELAWPGKSSVHVEVSPQRYSVTLTLPYVKRDQ